VHIHDFRDSYLPGQWADIKQCFEYLAKQIKPDLTFTHRPDARHQDHRVISDFTWCTFRDHLILKYEIPKYEGDLGNPNL
jgi:LmbE family N-acetylglucosaminyl deacetylase